MIFFDLETTNIRKGTALEPTNRVVMVSWCVKGGQIENFTGPIMEATAFWRDLQDADAACCYNAKFEMHWLKRLGFDIDSIRWHDPMLGEKVLLGNETLPMSMDKVAERYGFDTKDEMIDALMRGGVCPSEMPQRRLRARCNRDVRVLRSLHVEIVRRLKEREQMHLYRNRCDFAVILTHIEAEGMLLDCERVEEHYAKYAAEVADLTRRLDEITGGINMNSPDQKAHFLYGELGFPEQMRGKHPMRNKPSKQFPEGRPKTDAATIQWLMGQATTDRQREFVELQQRYSKANAALSKNLEFFRGVCLEHGGRFHAQFNQTVAATHRLTSSGMPLAFDAYGGKSKSVQFQNMPREFKSCFKAPSDDYYIVEVDAMQLEFRVAAFVGDDQQARADIEDKDFDAHCRSASVMNGVDYQTFLTEFRQGSKERKVQRQGAKADTFKPLYGGTKGTPEQELYYKSFAQRYSGLVRQQETWLAEVAIENEFRTPWGMTFRFNTYTNRRGVLMNKKTGKPVGPQVYNYPVQNLATAEIVPIGICSLYRRCKEQNLDVRFCNTIHDSIICYVKKAHIDSFNQEAAKAFTSDVYAHLEQHYDTEFNVPLGVESVYGQHWNQGDEFVFDGVTK